MLLGDPQQLEQPQQGSHPEGSDISAPPLLSGAGLWFAPVVHDGNRSHSPEEIEHVCKIIGELTKLGSMWTDAKGIERGLSLDDILTVAPYNDQVSRLTERLPGARVGTVDKFQGQQAAVVIYSMTTSTSEDVPRGMEFLYDPNRFNVATSRARCACIVVGSPRLFSPDCQTPLRLNLRTCSAATRR